MGMLFPFLQTLGASPLSYDFSNTMGSSLVIISSTFLRTLGCNFFLLIDFYIFRFLRWSLTWPSLKMGLCSSSPFLEVRGLKKWRKNDSQWKIRKNSTSSFSFQGTCTCTHSLCISFLLTQPCFYPVFVASFLTHGNSKHFSFKKNIIHHLCSAPVSLRAILQAISSTEALLS